MLANIKHSTTSFEVKFGSCSCRNVQLFLCVYKKIKAGGQRMDEH